MRGNKRMTKSEMFAFINSIGRSELFEELKDAKKFAHNGTSWSGYPRYLKAVRVTLIEAGYDPEWVEYDFKDCLEERYLNTPKIALHSALAEAEHIASENKASNDSVEITPPKYEKNDIVAFSAPDTDVPQIGYIVVCDLRSFYHPDEVTYDIYVRNRDVLYKHITEKYITEKVGTNTHKDFMFDTTLIDDFRDLDDKD